MLYPDSTSAKVSPELMPVRLKVAGMGGMQAVELTTATRNRPRNPPATHKSSLRLEGWRAPPAEFRIARNQMRRQIQRVGVSPDARGSAGCTYRILRIWRPRRSDQEIEREVARNLQ